MRHTYLILFFLLFFTSNTALKASCTVDAGEDIIVCPNPGSSGIVPATIAASIADGVAAPYTVRWEANLSYPDFDLHFTASHFLDDTTALQPTITEGIIELGEEPPLWFYVTITDANGDSCTDSVQVELSVFYYTLADCIHFINQGDSVALGVGVTGSHQPYSYEWSPNYNISDVNAANPFAAPDTTITYYATITNAAGCVGGGQCKIIVTPTSTLDLSTYGIEVYPNPAASALYIQTNGDRWQYKILDALGKEWRTGDLSYKSNALDVTDLPKGLYFLSLESRKQTQKPITLKWLKE